MTTSDRLELFDLRCEHRADPRGVDERHPRLAWRLRDPAGRRGAAQVAAMVRVEEVDSARPEDPRLVWESGWQSTPDPVIEYGGRPLSSTSTYRWTVQVRDDQGAESPPAIGHFTTGILHPDEWHAAWIGRNPRTLPIRLAPTGMTRPFRARRLFGPLQVRRSFALDAVPTAAIVHVTAKGIFRLHVNGKRVGTDELAPGWTDYHHRIPYLTYDVTELLATGENVIAAEVADGWWCGFVGQDPRNPAQHYGTVPEFLAQLHLRHADGGETVLATDATWREHLGEIQFADLLMGEERDLGKATPGWTGRGFDDSRWAPVIVTGHDRTRLVCASDEPVRITQRVPAVSLTRRGDDWIADFGQNLVGWVTLRAPAQAGVPVRLRHAEILTPDGELDTRNLRSAAATDTYLPATDGTHEFEPAFTTHGFRYAQISGVTGALEPSDVVAAVLHCDTPRAGGFHCDDELVSAIEANVDWGLRGNMVSVPTDCPQRDERLGWLADAQIIAPTMVRHFDVAAFLSRWMRDVVDGQDADGAFPNVVPRMLDHVVDREGAPGWGDAGVIIPWVLWRTYGDRRVLERSFPAMRAWVDHIHRHNLDLHWRNARGNDYGDWLSVDEDTPREIVASAYFAHSADVVARTADVLGDATAARHYGELAKRVRAAFTAAHLRPDGRIGPGTQTAQLMALAWGLVPDTARPHVLARLTESLEARGVRLTTGFLGVALLCPVLAEHGREDLAHALVTQTEYPSWGYSVRQGATTIWERWNAWTIEHGAHDPTMNSYNHYSLGSVSEWLAEGIAGLAQQPDAAGWRHLLVRPHPGSGITHASAWYLTPLGRAEVEWRRSGDQLTVRVDAPPGSDVLVDLPSADGKVHEGGVPVPDDAGALGNEKADGRVRVRVPSGRFEFSTTVPASFR